MYKQKFNEEPPILDDEKIVLDRAAFRALASDTRVRILKELDERRKTLTEISESVGLAVATVKEHMASLSSSGLVEVKDEGRKWKYYDLTNKGKAILYPERKKIWVMVAALIFTIILSGYMTFYDVGYVDGAYNHLPQDERFPLRTLNGDDAGVMGIEQSQEEHPEALDTADPDEESGSIAEEGDRDDSESENSDEVFEGSEDVSVSGRERIMSLPLLRYLSYLAALLIMSKTVLLGLSYTRKLKERD
ncbi:MAG: winged helix-turn-helix domain-containing protein [Candidatus Woesearchaeota archaeon]